MKNRLSTRDRQLMNREFVAIRSAIERIANVTEINGTKLLSGDIAGGSSTTPAQPSVVTAPVAQTIDTAKKETITFADFGLFQGLPSNQRGLKIKKNKSQAEVIEKINNDPIIGARVPASTSGSGELVLTSIDTGAITQFRVSSNLAAANETPPLPARATAVIPLSRRLPG
jgi:flagellin-like hook-associated protein FlgL